MIVLIVGLLVLCCGVPIAGLIIDSAIDEAAKVVIIDNEVIKITVNTNDYQNDSINNWCEYAATVENKTNEDLGVHFRDADADGVELYDQYYVRQTDGYSIIFAADRTTRALFIVEGDITGEITNFSGTLIVNGLDSDFYSEYDVFVAELS